MEQVNQQKNEQAIFVPAEEINSAPIVMEEKLVATPTGTTGGLVSEVLPRPEMNAKLTHKERITAFVEGRQASGKILLNDFLRSLYPVTKANERPSYAEQGVMKRLKAVLTELRAEGKINFVNDSFERLGKAYFPDHATGKTHYYDISTLPMEIIIP